MISFPFPQLESPSPLAGEGCEALANDSELRRSWMGGPRRKARSARALIFGRATVAAIIAAMRSREWRGYRRATPHPAPAKLGSASLSLRILPPQGGRGRIAMGVAAVLFVLFATPAHAVELTGHVAQGGLVIGNTKPGAKVLIGDRSVLVGDDGLFVFGFGRDQAKTAQLTITQADGTVEQQTLNIEQRTFDIQRINGME